MNAIWVHRMARTAAVTSVADEDERGPDPGERQQGERDLRGVVGGPAVEQACVVDGSGQFGEVAASPGGGFEGRHRELHDRA
jgi:hypothetical protein